MPKILVDILPAPGHINGSLKLILMLEEAGFEVIYLNQDPFKDMLKKHGLKHISTNQFIDQFEFSKWRWDLKHFNYRLFGINRESFFNKELSQFALFKKFVKEVSPDLVFLDDQNMLKEIYYRLCDVPVICIDTMLDSSKNENVPPYTSYFVPSNTKMSRFYCEIIWFKKISQNKLRLKIMQLNLVGTDYYSTAKKIALQNHIKLNEIIDLERGCGLGIKNIPHLIAAPSAFDFPRPTKTGIFDIGPLVNINREGEIEKPRYNLLIKNLTDFKNTKGGYIIFCSLGTITELFHRVKRVFLKRILKVALKNPTDLFILSAGKNFNLSEFYPIPDNLFLFDFLPQVDLLQYCDIMINHGGMNTITECIFCEVPMMVYPLSPYWDQPGDSARVVYHGLGLRGRINRDSAKTISKKLGLLKTNYPFYKKNVSEMKKKFEEKNNSKEAVEIVKNFLSKFTNK